MKKTCGDAFEAGGFWAARTEASLLQSLEADVTREELREALCTSSVSDIEMIVD